MPLTDDHHPADSIPLEPVESASEARAAAGRIMLTCALLGGATCLSAALGLGVEPGSAAIVIAQPTATPMSVSAPESMPPAQPADLPDYREMLERTLRRAESAQSLEAFRRSAAHAERFGSTPYLQRKMDESRLHVHALDEEEAGRDNRR